VHELGGVISWFPCIVRVFKVALQRAVQFLILLGNVLQLLHDRGQLVEVVDVVLEGVDVLVLRLLVHSIVYFFLEGVRRRAALLLMLDQLVTNLHVRRD